MTLSREDTRRRNAHPTQRGGQWINSYSGVVLASTQLWAQLYGQPGRCSECVWLYAVDGHNPDCPKVTRRNA